MGAWLRRGGARGWAAAAALALTGAALVGCGGGDDGNVTIAVIGDTPYGGRERSDLPALIAAINADTSVTRVVHLGDIKDGVDPCTDRYFHWMRHEFDAFADPVIYTPGDNEWTDCDRQSAGGFVPSERLARIRQVFFSEPGRTLGERSVAVRTQASTRDFQPLVENVMWREANVVFATVHVVGTNNDLAPWLLGGTTPENEAQRRERLAENRFRTLGTEAWMDRAFDWAEATDSAGVVIAMHADMWHPEPAGENVALDGFIPVVQRLAERSADFGRPVLLLSGDSHKLRVSRPLASGSPVHKVRTAAPNLQQLVVPGATTRAWIRLTIDASAPRLFSFREIWR
jgi:hypothetical protein